MYHILLYYKLTPIQHPSVVVRTHKEVCRALGLVGRIIIGPDGINGTVAGSGEAIELYKAYTQKTKPFEDIDFKESTHEMLPFSHLSVKEREEIVTTEARECFNMGKRGRHVDRDTLHAWLANKEDIILLDMRNDYEWEIGRFINSVRPPMKYFRDLKESMDFYEEFKGKKIVMFCTGGIRCEPASAMFLANGFDPDNLYQLEGGIVTYAEKYGDDGFYEGKCFVFDDRMAVPVGSPEKPPISSCALCAALCDTYRNCANRFCNKLFLACDGCALQYENACGDECKTVISDESALRPVAANHVMTHRNK